MLELEDATERMMLGGPERRSRVMTPGEKRLTAYHEAGHALLQRVKPFDPGSNGQVEAAPPSHESVIVARVAGI